MSKINSIHSHDYASGIRVVWSEAGNTQSFCEYMALQTNDKAKDRTNNPTWNLALVWFSVSRHDPKALSEQLSQNLGMESIAHYASKTRIDFLQSAPGHHSIFALNMIDGLTYSEELVTAALNRGLDDIPLIGGSAGDDLQFECTWQIHNGKTYTGASLLTLIQCQLPCQTFTNNNFVPTDFKLVVTDAEPEHRKVIEFNAEPAAQAYAEAIGSTVEELNAGSFASHSVVVKSGGKYYCRSIQQLNDDGSLTFFCAIDNGLVLTVARSEGMVASSHAAIDAIEDTIGPIDMLFGFDCVYRKLDARHRQTSHRIQALYRDANFVGFNTYGEQHNSMHINQTLTGVAIGHPASFKKE